MNGTVSAAIVTYNCRDDVLNAVRSLHENHENLKLYCFDNASSDGTNTALSKLPYVTLIENKENVGFGKAHNLALKEELGDYHAVINPDITVDGDVLYKLSRILDENPDIVMVTPKVLNSDGSVQALPKRKPTFKYLFFGRLSKKVRREYVSFPYGSNDNLCDIDFCTGCFFMIRSEVFKKLGGFDERFFMYLEDADLTLRAKQYGRVVYAKDISVTHLWHRDSAKKLKYILIHVKSALDFLRKWRDKK